MRLNSFLLRALCMGILVITAVGAAQAQFSCPSTVPDCPTFPWIPQQPFIITMPGANGGICSVRVHYCARKACNLMRDVYITGWEFLTNECIGISTQDLLDQSMTAIWGRTPNAWGESIPPCPTTDTEWRVYTAGCYTLIAHSAGDTDVVPCEENAQCWARYKVCRDSSGQIVKTLVYQGQATECPDEDLPPYEGGCVSGCPQ